MIYNFIYNGINVSVDTDAQKISYIEPPFENVRTVWYSKSFCADDKDKTIMATFESWKEDSNGVVIPSTFGVKTTLNKNTTLTETGVGQYDFFNSLQTGARSIGDIANHARLNNLLESLVDTFGDKIPCFNPYSIPAWSFFHPIQLQLASTPVTYVDEVAQTDGTITATVVNQVAGLTYEYSLDGATYQSSNVFTGLSRGNYNVYARSTTELVPRVKTITVY
jgi:hypothetical protein